MLIAGLSGKQSVTFAQGLPHDQFQTSRGIRQFNYRGGQEYYLWARPDLSAKACIFWRVRFCWGTLPGRLSKTDFMLKVFCSNCISVQIEVFEVDVFTAAKKMDKMGLHA